MLSNAKCSNLSQRGAKPAQARNEINGRGPPPAGRMPFMSDSTLSRRSAALSGQGPPNKLPTENSEEPLVRFVVTTLSFEDLASHDGEELGAASNCSAETVALRPTRRKTCHYELGAKRS